MVHYPIHYLHFMPLHSIATDRTSSLSPSRLCKRSLAILRKNRLNALAVLLLDRLINLEISMEFLIQVSLSRRRRVSISRRIPDLTSCTICASIIRALVFINYCNKYRPARIIAVYHVVFEFTSETLDSRAIVRECRARNALPAKVVFRRIQTCIRPPGENVIMNAKQKNQDACQSLIHANCNERVPLIRRILNARETRLT
jgi:hypothetical protein